MVEWKACFSVERLVFVEDEECLQWIEYLAGQGARS